MKKKGSAAYIYVGFFLLAVLAILIGNSYFLIDRTRSNLIEIYWKQGELIVKSIAASAQQSIQSVQLTPQQLRRHFKKVLTQIDSLNITDNTSTSDELYNILETENLQAIAIFDPANKPELVASKDGKVLYAKDEALSKLTAVQADHRIVKLQRDQKEGSVWVLIDSEKQNHIKTQIGLQLMVASLENRNIVQYISFIDDSFHVVADSDPYRIGILEEEVEYLDVLESGVSFYFRDSNEDVMIIIHPMEFSPGYRGILKIAYPITRIDKIYENTFKNVVLNSSVVMIIAIIAAFIAVKLNKRNLDKIETMEKQIREKEKLASLANLTAGVAHEVRNPLNSVAITIQRLQLEFTPKEEEDLEEYNALTSLMKGEVDRINSIITDFLDFAKPFEPKTNQINIKDFIDKSVDAISAEAHEKGIHFVKNISNPDSLYVGDKEKLTQVMINVLRNALDASSQNDEVFIESKLSKDQQNWELIIKDNGQGISKENIAHIFDIYFTTKKSGTGLGLYICRKIVHAHNGQIELSPNTDKGITVTIKLPLNYF